jgi:iron complex outermembrane receptor protein
LSPRPRRPGGAVLASAARLLAAFGLWADARAQVPADALPPDTVVPVAPLVVRTARPEMEAGASVVTVATDSLWTVPAPTLEAALRALPLVRVRANSRGEAQPSLRGSEERQLAVLVDGVPLTLGWDHRTDLSIVPATAVRELRIVRGLSSLLAGPNVLAGSVEMDVAAGEAPGSDRPLAFQAALDAAGGGALGAEVGVRPGSVRARLGFAYRDRPGVPAPDGLDAADGLRENSDLRHGEGYLVLRGGRDGGARWGAWASATAAERGVPPELHVSEPRLWRYPDQRRALVVLSAGTGTLATPWGRVELRAAAGADAAHTEIASYATRAYDTVAEREVGRDRTLTLRLAGRHSLGPRAELRVAWTAAEVRRDETLEPGGNARYRQRLWSLGAEVEAPLPLPPGAGPFGAARGTLGFAVDGAETPQTGGRPPVEPMGAWGAKAALEAVSRDGRVRVHAGASRRARFPSLREMYSGALGRFVPNPDLAPEVLAAAEAGATVAWGGGAMQAVLFHHRLTDAIVRTGLGDGRFRRENRNEVRSRGVELFAGGRLGRTSVAADLALQHVRLLDPDAPAGERRPEYQPGITAGLDLGLRGPLRTAWLSRVEFVGRQWCVDPEAGGQRAIAPSARWDLALERAWRVGARTAVLARVAVDNATDAVVFEQCGLPQPGRTLRLELRWR